MLYNLCNFNKAYGLNYERLRIGQNFRELIGQMIRDGRTPFKPSAGDPYGDTRLVHSGSEAPDKTGVWFSGKDGEGPFLGEANVFLYQGNWYNEAFELAPVFNVADIVDNEIIRDEKKLGRPTSKFIVVGGIHYQLFDNGLAFIGSDGKIHYRFEDTMALLNLRPSVKAEFIRIGAVLPE